MALTVVLKDKVEAVGFLVMKAPWHMLRIVVVVVVGSQSFSEAVIRNEGSVKLRVNYRVTEE